MPSRLARDAQVAGAPPFEGTSRMAPYAQDLEAALRRAAGFAREVSHAQVGTEHVLLALLDEPCAAAMLRALQVDRDTLRRNLAACLDDEPLATEGAELQSTDTLQRVLARAALNVQASGAIEMTGAHAILAIVGERCRAAGFLQEQGVARDDAVAYVRRTIIPPPPPAPETLQRVAVPEKGYVDLPFPEAVRELDLERRLGGRCLWNYYETADAEIARIESDSGLLSIYDDKPDWRDKVRRRHRPVPYVRYWSGDAVIDGDLDLDTMFDPYSIAGFAVDGNASMSGSVTNWEIDTHTSFLSVAGHLTCTHVIAGSSDIVVHGDVRASGVIVATYSRGWLEIGGDVHARALILDEHHAEIRGKIHAPGWASRDDSLPLPVSEWRDEVRPEFFDEFFDADGDLRCGNGNAALVEALVAGRDILKRRRRRR
jgi:hypothetical protein